MIERPHPVRHAQNSDVSPGGCWRRVHSSGEQIERVAVASADASPMRIGQHTTYLPLKRDELADGAQRSLDQAEYDRCIEDQRNAADRRRPKPERRDSTRTRDLRRRRTRRHRWFQRRAERACKAQQRSRISQSIARRPRYLALIATDASLSPDQVDAWLNSLPVPTDDVPAALTAVADVLFRDRRAAWSAVYQRWW